MELKAVHNLIKTPGGKKFLHNGPSKANIFSGNAQTSDGSLDDTGDRTLQQSDDGMIRMQIVRTEPINQELCDRNDDDGEVAQIVKYSKCASVRLAGEQL